MFLQHGSFVRAIVSRLRQGQAQKIYAHLKNFAFNSVEKQPFKAAQKFFAPNRVIFSVIEKPNHPGRLEKSIFSLTCLNGMNIAYIFSTGAKKKAGGEK